MERACSQCPGMCSLVGPPGFLLPGAPVPGRVATRVSFLTTTAPEVVPAVPVVDDEVPPEPELPVVDDDVPPEPERPVVDDEVAPEPALPLVRTQGTAAPALPRVDHPTPP